MVADACRDRTAEVARRGGAAVVTTGARNVGAARAAGVREVLRRTGHLDPADVWLATTDADTLVPALLAAPAGALRQPGLGRGGWHDPGRRLVRLPAWHALAVPQALRRREPGPHSHVHGANLGFRASAYLQAGGFPDGPQQRTTPSSQR